MPEFMLFVRGGDGGVDELTNERARQRVQEYIAWSARLRDEGRNLGANELATSGPVLRASGGGVTVDGPVEAGGAIGGYFHISAASEEEAIEIARGCPTLNYGGAVEVRAIIEH